MKKTLTALVLTAIALAGCTSASAATEDVDVIGFAQVIEDSSIIILDVRTPEEFAQGHIAGSINIDVSNSNFIPEVSKLDKTKTYAVYCRSGNRSEVATAEMEKLGFTSLYNMTGGAIDWSAAGYPLVTP
jgi:phage shock protein E